jgi:membrane protein
VFEERRAGCVFPHAVGDHVTVATPVRLSSDGIRRRASRIRVALQSPHDRLRTYNPWPVAVGMTRSAARHRLPGHAAEISFYALLALVPGTVVIGATLRVLVSVGGAEMHTRGQDAAINAIRLLMGPRLTDSVVAPFVRTQLTEPNGGVAVGGVIITWWLFSHLFTATGHAVDAAYAVTHRRTTIIQRLIALACVTISVVVITVTLAFMVIAQHSGHEPALVRAWDILRWPLLLTVLIGALLGVYRYIPSVSHRWRDCLPGAVLGVVLWVLAAAFFRAYLLLGAGDPTGVAADDPQVVLIGRTVGAVVATAVWMYFSSIAVLLGAELNAELARRRSVC